VFHVFGIRASFERRGEEISKIKLTGILKHFEEGGAAHQKHVMLPLVGRFKQVEGEQPHFLPVAAVTGSGIKMKVLFNKHKIHRSHTLVLIDGNRIGSKRGGIGSNKENDGDKNDMETDNDDYDDQDNDNAEHEHSSRPIYLINSATKFWTPS
jgi:hypothetical protein